jgi:glutathione S-transferase
MVALKGGPLTLAFLDRPPRITLAVKSIPYMFQKVDLGSDEQRSQEYHDSRNRLEQIPLLQVGEDTLLRQSVAILEYLEEAYPGKPKLLPDDPIDRARVREIVEIVNSYIQPMQNTLTIEKVAEMDDKLAKWLPRAVTAHTTGVGTTQERRPPRSGHNGGL